MTTATFRIGQVQQAALEIYVFDVAHEGDEERAIDGRLEAGKLVINGSLDSAHRADVAREPRDPTRALRRYQIARER
jgi:hypothetical protein